MHPRSPWSAILREEDPRNSQKYGRGKITRGERTEGKVVRHHEKRGKKLSRTWLENREVVSSMTPKPQLKGESHGYKKKHKRGRRGIQQNLPAEKSPTIPGGETKKKGGCVKSRKMRIGLE